MIPINTLADEMGLEYTGGKQSQWYRSSDRWQISKTLCLKGSFFKKSIKRLEINGIIFESHVAGFLRLFGDLFCNRLRAFIDNQTNEKISTHISATNAMCPEMSSSSELVIRYKNLRTVIFLEQKVSLKSFFQLI